MRPGLIKYYFATAIWILAVGTCWTLGNGSTTSRADTRDGQIEELQAKIDASASNSKKIEFECSKVYLWLGQGCEEGPDTKHFMVEAERILKQYKTESYNYYYLELSVTHAQLIPIEKGEPLLLEIIATDPRKIQVPANGTRTRWINRLKQGAVFAYLNGTGADAIPGNRDVQKRRIQEETAKLIGQMKNMDEGKRCIPLALTWRDMAMADMPKRIPNPVLEAPPLSSSTAKPAGAEGHGKPAFTQPIIIPEATTKPVKDIRLQHTFDSVKYIGMVNGAGPLSPATLWFPSVLAAVGAALVVIGVFLIGPRPAKRI